MVEERQLGMSEVIKYLGLEIRIDAKCTYLLPAYCRLCPFLFLFLRLVLSAKFAHALQIVVVVHFDD
jgi:hypothetical protein